MLVAISVGSVHLPLRTVWAVVLDHLSGGALGIDGAADRRDDAIVWNFRAPRALLAVVVGVGLAVAGAALQVLVRNPLADPYVLGVVQGGSLGAVIAIAWGTAAIGKAVLSTAAFLGAMTCLLLVLFFGRRAGRVSPGRLVLSGLAVGYVFQSATSFVQLRLAEGESLAGVVFWLLGTVAAASWADLGVPTVLVLVTTVWLLTQARPMNALLMGDDSATALGIRVSRLRLQLAVAASVLTACVVAVATFDSVPQRIFTLDPQSAEFLIALGLGDRIVGTWGMYDEAAFTEAPKYATELKKIKKLGDGKTWPPPIEQIASTKPDVVVTTYRLNIPNYLDADRLEKDTGIKAFSFTSYCTGATMRDFEPLFNDIAALGGIFDVRPKSDALIAELRGQLAKAAALTQGKPRVKVWQYAGEEVPYPVGGTGIPNAIMYLAGADNVFEDVRAVYGEVSWEQVVKRNASVVWLQTSAGPGFIETEDALKKATEKNPGIAGIEGIAKKRYVVVPYTTAGTLSIHNAEAVLEFATKLQQVGAAS